MHTYFLGIDIGTQGARLALIDERGDVVGSWEEGFALSAASREEQSPGEWWAACRRCLEAMVGVDGIDLKRIRAIGVTSTSGTVIPLDGAYRPLHNALMYSDKRSSEEGKICTALALQHQGDGYTAFNSSSGLSKMFWYVRNYPEQATRIALWVHAADYITGKLSGRWGVTDHTNALKSGYDVRRDVWPHYIYEELPLRKEWLSEVVPSGKPIGVLEPGLANELGLLADVVIVAGMTDGCASQIASGAVNPGDWNTTVGTTLVIKGVTKQELSDPEGRFYCHRHPEGWWMPGGASNTGADWVTHEFGKGELGRLEREASGLIPTGYLAYPLRQEGERFPFIAAQARGFAPKEISGAMLFTANMEGVAYIERYAYELVMQLSGERVSAIFTAGGGSNSDTWLTIRSNVLGLPIYKMKEVTGAVGAAILAASNTYYSTIASAAKAMTQVEKVIYPMEELTRRYDLYYKAFLKALKDKGYTKG